MIDRQFKRGAEAAASIAGGYDATSAHSYKIGDCILGKLNLTNRKPRKNKHALDQWLQGFGLALAEVNRSINQPTTVKLIMRAAGVTLAKLKRAGLDAYDLDELRKVGEGLIMLDQVIVALCQWIARQLPHEHITRGYTQEPYLERYVIWQNEAGSSIYLHNFVGPDNKDLHNHPWRGWAFVLSGSYLETRQEGIDGIRHENARQRFYINRIEPDTFHRTEAEQPCWTLFFTGPRVQKWGYLIDGKFITAKEHRRRFGGTAGRDS